MDNQQQPQDAQGPRGPFGNQPPQQPESQRPEFSQPGSQRPEPQRPGSPQPESQPPWHAHPGQRWPTQQWPPAAWPVPGAATWPTGSVPPQQPPPTMPPSAQPGTPAGRSPRRRRAVPALVAAALVVAAAAGGVGIGHVLWPGSQSASGSPIALSSGGSGSSGSSNSGSGSTNGGGSNNGSNSNGGSGATSNPHAGSGNGTNNGGTGDGSNNGGGGSSDDGGSGGDNPGDGGQGTWPPSLLPGGLLPGQGQWPGNGSGDSGPGTGSTITSAPGSPSDLSGIRDKVDNAIVDINVTFAYQQAAGAGTGIVLTPTGEVLTNNHVIDGATSISVTDLGNGKTYAASVLGYDATGDIAVLQLKNASGLATATIGNSKTLAVGDAVVGIGNAGGVGGTPSAAGGSVTALNRSISVGDELYGTTAHLTGLIEVNAAIESGDSGGPLVTSSGAVVGMDTAASAGPAVQDGSGDGYAIPIDTALSVVKIIESGTGTSTVHVGATAALGVLISTTGQAAGGDQYPGRLGSGTSEGSGLPVRGAQVAGVVNGGAAAKAGLAQGDVITSLGGHAVSSSTELSRLMSSYRPGQSVTIGWTDVAGQNHTATITLGTGPAA